MINKNLWAKAGHFNEDQFHFVYNLVQNLKPAHALEIGFCTGRSSHAILEAGKVSLKKMMSIDIDLDYNPLGREYKDKLELHYKNNHFRVIEACSHDTLNTPFFETNFPSGIDFALVDGDHSYTGCLQDILSVLPYVNQGGIILIDDYKSGPPNGCSINGVDQACEFISSSQPSLLRQEWNCKGKGFCIFTKKGKNENYPRTIY